MENPNDNSTPKTVLILLWLFSVVAVGVIGYLLGKSGRSELPLASKPEAQIDTITPVPTRPATAPSTAHPPTQTGPTAGVDLSSSCEKSGPSQKKDYLRSYILKEGDTVNKIAEEVLGDVSRNSEILTINENNKNLTIGSVLYLPPENIPRSSGYIYEVSGKIVKKDASSWQLTYGGGPEGLGIWMPGYWFNDIPNLDQYKVGDCVTILFDNGVKVYSVRRST